MIVMTDGLRALAGGAMRSVLMRFTRSPLSGAMTGAATTAILQSSSATTVAVVGFVGAGLMNFPEALGIIFGANIGTTITGWFVVLLGFKLNMGTLVLPLILFGAILRLFTHGRVATIGLAIAGFGLIFVGITMMQQGMGGLENIVTPANFPPDTLIGRLTLVAIGILITLITQSSSAGVAAALTALFMGAINFEQAVALVIGMDVGTTVTAAMATIGGSVGSRRTGLSHVIFNLFTGTGAIIMITPYIFLWETIAPGQLINNAEVALVAFHTSFNILGVIAVLPFTNRFAHLMEKLIVDKAPVYTRHLDRALLADTNVALSAVQSTVRDELLALLSHMNAILGDKITGKRIDLHELKSALDETNIYINRIHLSDGKGPNWGRLIAIIHLLDHMQRLYDRCKEDKIAP